MCENCRPLIDRSLDIGQAVQVYHAGKFEGEAVLLERLPDREVPFLKKRCLPCGTYINYIKERWKVRFVSGPQKGWETARKIETFHSTGLVSINPNEEEE